ncbi:hypothetical protein [Klebsiella quasipneumoniae]|uniref:hypothetical protein n=3 Tax=Klebsiella quasipneumoniae TaxID=1463165 RepID=UPI001649A687
MEMWEGMGFSMVNRRHCVGANGSSLCASLIDWLKADGRSNGKRGMAFRRGTGTHLFILFLIADYIHAMDTGGANLVGANGFKSHADEVEDKPCLNMTQK